MCGILAVLGLRDGAAKFRSTAVTLSSLLRHRGPDWSGVYCKGNNVICHERLAIIDPLSGSQPLFNETKDIVLAVNGEIYNHGDIRRDLIQRDHKFSSKSDCEVILHKYEEEGPTFMNELRGMYAFALYDENRDRFIAARDPIGIIPMYYGFGEDGSIWFSSEMKALVSHCNYLDVFPPGHVYDSETGTFERFFQPKWTGNTSDQVEDKIKTALVDSVRSHMMSDVPYGVLLSGGLDSSLVASIAQRVNQETGDTPLHSFAIGLEGSPDLDAAANVAEFIGTKHYNLQFTVQDGLDALSEVIYHLETYDVTTVRASVPMYLMARKIKAMGMKMVLSGEGADEIFGGYLYFHKAPSPQAFFDETMRKVEKLNLYDCLRANKAMSAWGVETRVPFLDSRFLDVAMEVDPIRKMTKDENTGEPRIEKHVLRKAFDEQSHPYLPQNVLWRQKEQFSDGVGYSWIDSLKEYAEQHVSQGQMQTAAYRFQYNTPATKEAYLYRTIFEGYFPGEAAMKTVPGGPSVACSTPAAIEWDASFRENLDPSGRAVSVHNESL